MTAIPPRESRGALTPKLKTDGVGFEPTRRFHVCRFSRPVHSTALPPIHRTVSLSDREALSNAAALNGFDEVDNIFYSRRIGSLQKRNLRFMGGISNRMKEIKRRRHRRKKLVKFQSKLKKSTTSEKLVMAQKLRKMTTGCNAIIAHMGLEERKRG